MSDRSLSRSPTSPPPPRTAAPQPAPAPAPAPGPAPLPRPATGAKPVRTKKTYEHLKANSKTLGTTILPVTRVTRAAKQDKDIKIVSKEAVFLISIATEFFIRKLTDSGFEESRREKRVFVKYNDIASAVRNNPEYGWLESVIPSSRPLGSVLRDPMIPSASTAITNQLPAPIVGCSPPSVGLVGGGGDMGVGNERQEEEEEKKMEVEKRMDVDGDGDDEDEIDEDQDL